MTVFSDPNNLVLTGLDGSKMLPSLTSNSWGPRIPDMHEDESPLLIAGLKGSPSPPAMGSPNPQGFSPRQFTSSPVFKTDRLDYGRQQSTGLMPGYDRIYLPEGDEADSRHMYHKTFAKPHSEIPPTLQGNSMIGLQSPFSLSAAV
jgi:hypothetical protein